MNNKDWKKTEFDVVIMNHKNEILCVIKKYLSNNNLAEDVLQDAFIRAYKYMDSFKGESSLKTWITGIAINLAKDYEKKEKKRQHYTIYNAEFMEIPEKRDMFIETNNNIDISKAVDSLPESMKTIINSVYFECYSLKETANLLNISYGTAKSRLSRARNKLRLILSES